MTDNKNIQNNDKIAELFIIDNNNTTIFKDNYLIPNYQRVFAWENNEVEQLLKDIYEIPNSHKNYYLGTLIVKKRDFCNKYEVIDGQQRLTALFILLSYLKSVFLVNSKLIPLEYESRAQYDKFFKEFSTPQNTENFDFKNYKNIENLKNCYDSIKTFFKNHTDRQYFVNNLKKAVLFRIEVPEKTDLNRYFEAMNTRGEQLEQHEILKADLMENLGDKNNQTPSQKYFAEIWDACQNMDSYMQTSFSTDKREKLFGKYYSSYPKIEKSDFDIEASESDKSNTESYTIDKIINDKKNNTPTNNQTDKDKEVYFESIITFPYFLLHVLKVYKYTNSNESEKENFFNNNELLNIVKLKNDFDELLKDKSVDEKKKFSIEFVKLLLKCRYLFDKYIIKRKYDNNEKKDNGEWSLQRYSKTTVAYDYARSFENKNKNILMLQACLRVSITAPNSMHWITQLLCYLYEEHSKNDISEKEFTTKLENNFEDYIEKIIKHKFVSDYLNIENAKTIDKQYKNGIATPHIVLNYLDYLLWKIASKDNCNLSFEGIDILKSELKKIKANNFNFEYRNTVEHWYPRNPENNKQPWVDMFGNLCLLARNDNSRFSNLFPLAKKSQYEKNKITTASLKLRLMSNLTNNNGNENSQDNSTWTEEEVTKHQKLMIDLLNTACSKQ